MKEHFVIENRLHELPVLTEKIDQLAERWNLPAPLNLNINLVLEEAISNIIFYGYPNNGRHMIEISLTFENQLLTIAITDDGIPFDPTIKEDPDITLPASKRPEGGLGIFLIRKTTDSMSYGRNNNRNILILTKSI